MLPLVQGLLAQFVDYIKDRKTVMLDEVAAEFGLRTQDVINRIQSLESHRAPHWRHGRSRQGGHLASCRGRFRNSMSFPRQHRVFCMHQEEPECSNREIY